MGLKTLSTKEALSTMGAIPGAAKISLTYELRIAQSAEQLSGALCAPQ